MDFTKEYWYLVLAGLAAVFFIFGYKSDKTQQDEESGQEDGSVSGGKNNKSGHSCCH